MDISYFYKYYYMIGFFVLWYINLRGLFDARAILVEEQWYYFMYRWEDKKIHGSWVRTQLTSKP